MSNNAILLGLVISLCVTSRCFATDEDFELVVYTEEFPPFNFLYKGRIRGINKDIVELACKSADIYCSFKILPWSRAFKLTQMHSNSGLIST